LTINIGKNVINDKIKREKREKQIQITAQLNNKQNLDKLTKYITRGLKDTN
jgi:hypothetical protein